MKNVFDEFLSFPSKILSPIFGDLYIAMFKYKVQQPGVLLGQGGHISRGISFFDERGVIDLDNNDHNYKTLVDNVLPRHYSVFFKLDNGDIVQLGHFTSKSKIGIDLGRGLLVDDKYNASTIIQGVKPVSLNVPLLLSSPNNKKIINQQELVLDLLKINGGFVDIRGIKLDRVALINCWIENYSRNLNGTLEELTKENIIGDKLKYVAEIGDIKTLESGLLVPNNQVVIPNKGKTSFTLSQVYEPMWGPYEKFFNLKLEITGYFYLLIDLVIANPFLLLNYVALIVYFILYIIFSKVMYWGTAKILFYYSYCVVSTILFNLKIVVYCISLSDYVRFFKFFLIISSLILLTNFYLFY